MKKIKVKIKVLLRLADDVCTGAYFKFPKKTSHFSFSHTKVLQQIIKPSETFDNKIYNLKLASEKINEYVIKPGQIFSFWNIIGNPEGLFKKSRSIINGKLTEEAGGGLCQISGMIYYTALLSGVEVLERYNHSVDIYNNETRFTPLGTDATVVYGYKDLRIRNNFDFPLRFCITVNQNSIDIELQSPLELPKKTLAFVHKETTNDIFVTTRDENEVILNQSKYGKHI